MRALVLVFLAACVLKGSGTRSGADHIPGGDETQVPATSGGSDGGSSSGSSAGSGGPVTPPPVIGDCSNLPAPGTWEDITPHAGLLPGATALDPFTAGSIWMGAKGGGDSIGGMYASTNCGSTWARTNDSGTTAIDTADIWSMAVDYTDAGTLYVIGQYGPYGIWKSTDFGVTWVQQLDASGTNGAIAQMVGTPSNPPLAQIGSISMDPVDHLHLVAGTHASCAGHNPLCQIETIDGGARWNEVDVIIPGADSWMEQTGPYALNDSSTLYATLDKGLWLTTDSGAHWNNVTPAQVSGAGGGEYTHHPLSKSAAGYYYLPASGGQNGLLRSSDGLAWERIANSPSGGYELGPAVGGGKLFMVNFGTPNSDIQTATETDPTHWTTFPGPQAPGGTWFLDYDDTHHVLYASNSKLWRIVVP